MTLRTGMTRTAPETLGSRLVIWGVHVVLALWPAALAAQFAVYPVRVDMEATDRVVTEVFTVENRGETLLDLTVYTSDFDRTPEGDHSYLAYGEHAHSCAGRMEIFPDQLSLEPGELEEVRVRMRPDSATCWGLVFVERRTPTSSGIVMAQRIGVKVVSQSGALLREGRVLGLRADTTAEPAVRVAFENQGEGMLEVEGELEVRSLEGEVVAVVDAEAFRVLPGHEWRTRIPLSSADLAPGRYIVVAILDFGGDYLAGGQTMIEVE